MRSILIVEDDNTLRLRLARAFRARRILVVETASPDRAVTLARESRPQNALVDLCLGAYSGLDVVRALHALDATIDIVMWSGHANGRAAELALQAGARAFVRKPVAVEPLLHQFPRLRNSRLA